MAEFLQLAHRVVDSGDLVSMEALTSLKTKWEETMGPVAVTQVVQMSTLKPVDEHVLTLFPLLVGFVWRDVISFLHWR
ncbi:UNVERIFIED_CONTAM: hypothetical protein Sradi_3851100 [Sesamum radiatum]|uniref:Uncharacterized protein n=1 Tax=Sesamum radiatum TaxID=300843 RepID=A0AAW2Q226_SESRA